MSLNCNFNRDYCEYFNSQKATMSWRLGSSTLSTLTGPISPYSGKFVYYEATNSSPRNFAILESPAVVFDRIVCLSFVYHMYGADMGRFMVSLVTYDRDEVNVLKNETLLNVLGNQGFHWKHFFREITDISQPSVSR